MTTPCRPAYMKDLDPYEYRLMDHYLEVDVCYESTRTTAERTHMSAAKVSRTRAALLAKQLITVRMMTVDELKERGAFEEVTTNGRAEVCVVIPQGVADSNLGVATGNTLQVGASHSNTLEDVLREEPQGVADSNQYKQLELEKVPTPIESKKKKSVARKTAPRPRGVDSLEPPEPVVGGDEATYPQWQEWLSQKFQVGRDSPRARYLYNMFKGRAKTGVWKENNIMPPVTLDEAKRWVAFEEREALKSKGEARFVYGRPETINARFLHWRDKQAKKREDDAYRADAERQWQAAHPELYPAAAS